MREKNILLVFFLNFCYVVHSEFIPEYTNSTQHHVNTVENIVKMYRNGNITWNPPVNREKRTITEEAEMTTIQLIQWNGYPAESHNVETKDNYVLDIHRIPYSPKSPMCRNKKKPVVFLAHDIISSSSDWVINGPEESLGYILADNGYDVWMANYRGNRYSRKHRGLIPSMNNFWDFTFHEVGTYDLPAMIDFALKETEEDSLIYIGHSMGTTVYFVMMSMNPQYNEKVKAAFLMSPVVYLAWMLSPLLRLFATFVNAISLMFDVVGIGEFIANYRWMAQFGQLVCKGTDFTQPVCTSVLFILSGYNAKNLNFTRFPVYMGHTPAGTSVKTFVHYGQLIQSGSFKQMDWGVVDNIFRYNHIKAPRYNLMSATSPMYIIYSNNDWFANRHDVERLYRELVPGSAQLIEVKDGQFAHIDFTFGTNAKEEVYDDILEIMKKY